MNTTPKITWISIYLYYEEPWETFLLEALEPFVNTLLKNNHISRYFYIRYWDKGPHIRLRLNCEKKLRKEITEKAVKHFENYILKNPSLTVSKASQTGGKNIERRLNNSLYIIKYIPEYHRYGGRAAISIAEDQFYLSSKIILKEIRANQIWSEIEAVTYAVIYNLLTARVFCESKLKLVKFFDLLVKNLLPFTRKLLGEKSNTDNNHEMSVLRSFEKLYSQQKKPISLLIEETLTGFKGNTDIFENKSPTDYIKGMNQVAAQLQSLYKNGQLRTHKWYIIENGIRTEDEDLPLWSIIFKYIHMSNNRLGIKNVDEPYIAYLIFKGLQEYNGEI